MDENPSPGKNRGNISIQGSVTAGVASIGHGNTIHASQISQGAPPPLDQEALKHLLLELFGALGVAGLPPQVQMETQTATGLAAQQADTPIPQVEALAHHLQQVGQTLQRAQVTLEQGSHLTTTIVKLAQLLGPVVGGAHLVARWFGIPLP